MNKSILIFCPGTNYIDTWDEDVMEKTGLGGSETFFAELSSELAKHGHKVVLAADVKKRHISKDGVEYIHSNEAIHEYSKYEFDIGLFYFAKFVKFFSCKKNILIPTCELAQYSSHMKVDKEHGLDDLDAVVSLSVWHNQNLMKNGISEEKLFLIPFGTNMWKDFQEVDFSKKEVSMVWSSRPERNFAFFMDYVYPKVVKYYTEFKVYFCSYLNESEYEKYKERYKGCNIEFVGSASKPDLHELQKKCMIWAYPNIGLNVSCEGGHNYFFHETFCYTALENAMARNEIVCFGDGKDGISTTLEGTPMLPGNLFNEYGMFYPEDFEAIGNAMAAEMLRRIYSVLNGNTNHLNVYAELCKNKYEWEHIILFWERLFEEV